MTADKVLARLEGFHHRGRILQTSLSQEDEQKLRDALSGGGVDVFERKALDLIWGYGVGLDMTRREVGAQLDHHVLVVAVAGIEGEGQLVGHG